MVQKDPNYLAAVVDRLGALDVELAPHEAAFKEREAKRAGLRAEYKDADPLVGVEVRGKLYVADLGACGNTTVIDKRKLLKLIKQKLFVEIAAITGEAMKRANVAPGIIAAVSSMLQTGSRTLNVRKLDV